MLSAKHVAFARRLLETASVQGLTPELLAPGDGKSAALDPANFSWKRIRSTEDPKFNEAYAALWAEFGAKHEMETVATLTARFAHTTNMQYEMIVAREEDGQIAAVRDHTAVWVDNEVVVHLSHVLVAAQWRRSGLAGWMRAVPILVAREVADRHGAQLAPITLVGEMEYDDGSDLQRGIRLKAYERAGYLKVEPGFARYHQPDFRETTVIDASGGPCPLPFQLIVRQVGREGDRIVPAERVKHWVRALYSMYGAQFRPSDMAHIRLCLDHYDADPRAAVALLPPTHP